MPSSTPPGLTELLSSRPIHGLNQSHHTLADVAQQEEKEAIEREYWLRGKDENTTDLNSFTSHLNTLASIHYTSLHPGAKFTRHPGGGGPVRVMVRRPDEKEKMRRRSMASEVLPERKYKQRMVIEQQQPSTAVTSSPHSIVLSIRSRSSSPDRQQCETYFRTPLKSASRQSSRPTSAHMLNLSSRPTTATKQQQLTNRSASTKQSPRPASSPHYSLHKPNNSNTANFDSLTTVVSSPTLSSFDYTPSLLLPSLSSNYSHSQNNLPLKPIIKMSQEEKRIHERMLQEEYGRLMYEVVGAEEKMVDDDEEEDDDAKEEITTAKYNFFGEPLGLQQSQKQLLQANRSASSLSQAAPSSRLSHSSSQSSSTSHTFASASAATSHSASLASLAASDVATDSKIDETIDHTSASQSNTTSTSSLLQAPIPLPGDSIDKRLEKARRKVVEEEEEFRRREEESIGYFGVKQKIEGDGDDLLQQQYRLIRWKSNWSQEWHLADSSPPPFLQNITSSSSTHLLTTKLALRPLQVWKRFLLERDEYVGFVQEIEYFAGGTSPSASSASKHLHSLLHDAWKSLPLSTLIFEPLDGLFGYDHDGDENHTVLQVLLPVFVSALKNRLKQQDCFQARPVIQEMIKFVSFDGSLMDFDLFHVILITLIVLSIGLSEGEERMVLSPKDKYRPTSAANHALSLSLERVESLLESILRDLKATLEETLTFIKGEDAKSNLLQSTTQSSPFRTQSRTRGYTHDYAQLIRRTMSSGSSSHHSQQHLLMRSEDGCMMSLEEMDRENYNMRQETPRELVSQQQQKMRPDTAASLSDTYRLISRVHTDGRIERYHQALISHVKRAKEQPLQPAMRLVGAPDADGVYRVRNEEVDVIGVVPKKSVAPTESSLTALPINSQPQSLPRTNLRLRAGTSTMLGAAVAKPNPVFPLSHERIGGGVNEKKQQGTKQDQLLLLLDAQQANQNILTLTSIGSRPVRAIVRPAAPPLLPQPQLPRSSSELTLHPAMKSRAIDEEKSNKKKPKTQPKPARQRFGDFSIPADDISTANLDKNLQENKREQQHHQHTKKPSIADMKKIMANTASILKKKNINKKKHNNIPTFTRTPSPTSPVESDDDSSMLSSPSSPAAISSRLSISEFATARTIGSSVPDSTATSRPDTAVSIGTNVNSRALSAMSGVGSTRKREKLEVQFTDSYRATSIASSAAPSSLVSSVATASSRSNTMEPWLESQVNSHDNLKSTADDSILESARSNNQSSSPQSDQSQGLTPTPVDFATNPTQLTQKLAFGSDESNAVLAATKRGTNIVMCRQSNSEQEIQQSKEVNKRASITCVDSSSDTPPYSPPILRVTSSKRLSYIENFVYPSASAIYSSHGVTPTVTSASNAATSDPAAAVDTKPDDQQESKQQSENSSNNNKLNAPKHHREQSYQAKRAKDVLNVELDTIEGLTGSRISIQEANEDSSSASSALLSVPSSPTKSEFPNFRPNLTRLTSKWALNTSVATANSPSHGKSSQRGFGGLYSNRSGMSTPKSPSTTATSVMPTARTKFGIDLSSSTTTPRPTLEDLSVLEFRLACATEVYDEISREHRELLDAWESTVSQGGSETERDSARRHIMEVETTMKNAKREADAAREELKEAKGREGERDETPNIIEPSIVTSILEQPPSSPPIQPPTPLVSVNAVTPSLTDSPPSSADPASISLRNLLSRKLSCDLIELRYPLERAPIVPIEVDSGRTIARKLSGVMGNERHEEVPRDATHKRNKSNKQSAAAMRKSAKKPNVKYI